MGRFESFKNFFKQDKSEKNNDYITTLDIEGRNKDSEGKDAGFRDKANGFKNFWEHAKILAGSMGEKNSESTKSNKIFPGLEQAIKEEQEQQAAQAETITRQRKDIGELMMEYGKEESDEMKKVAGMIERFGPKVEGGYGDVVEALKNNTINSKGLKLKEKAIQTINIVLKENKWHGENLTSLNIVKGRLEQSVNAAHLDVQKAQSPQEGMGEVLEGFAENAKRKEVYSKLGKLIEQHNPLQKNNKELADVFNKPETPPIEALQAGLKAVEALKTMAKWPKETMAVLNDAEKFIKKDLGQ